MLALATTSFANLGETLPELKHRFKDSKYTTRLKGGETIHIFTGKNQEVRVVLEGGVSSLEIYNMATPFTPAIMADLAYAVAPGNTWHSNKEGDFISDNGRVVVTLGNPRDGYMWSMAVGYALAGLNQ